MLKYIPGILGAVAGFITLQLTSWFNNWSYEIAVFIAVYLFVTVSLDMALVRYGKTSVK